MEIQNYKKLATITNKDFDLPFEPNENYKIRKSVRGIIFDNNGKIALLNMENGLYYMLPGGGIEKGENEIQALIREIKEECGVNIKNIIPLGFIEEKRSLDVMKEIGKNNAYINLVFGFTAKVDGIKGKQQLEQDEKEANMTVERLNINEVEKILSTFKIHNKIGKFTTKRDLIFLQETKKILNEI